MLNKNKLIISSFLLISTIAFTQQPSFANDDSNVKKVNVEEKEKTNDSVVNSGILKDINIKFHDEIVKDTLKFKVTNEKDGTFFDYTSIDGKLTGVKVIAG